LTDVKSGAAGEHHIEDDEIRPNFVKELQTLVTIVCVVAIERLALEVETNDRGDSLIVFND
jgi:hypothetical protein